jgi:hypothetical protein
MALAIFEVMRVLEALSPKQMSASHRLVLLVLADHARDSDRAWPSLSRLAAMTGLARSTVVTCLNELEAARWIERQGCAPAGPGGRASTMYLVRTSGGSVVRAPSPPVEAPATSPMVGLVQLPDQSDNRTSPITGRQGSDYRTAGVRLPDGRGPVTGHKSLRESPMEAPKEDHPPAGDCAPASAARVEGSDVGAVAGTPEFDGGGDPEPTPASVRPMPSARPAPPVESPKRAAVTGPLPLFGAMAPAGAAAPAKAARRAPRSSARAADEPPAGQRYAEAYAQGQTDVTGAPFAVPPQKSVFWPILKAYALDADGQPLTGEAATAWIRASSAEYRRAKSGQEHFEKGFTPPKWAEWLQGGKPTTGPRSGRVVQFQGGRTDPDERAAHQRKRAAELALHLEQDGI